MYGILSVQRESTSPKICPSKLKIRPALETGGGGGGGRWRNKPSEFVLCEKFRPNSYVAQLPSHCHSKPSTFYCLSSEYNRLDLVRHGSGTTSEFGLICESSHNINLMSRSNLSLSR